MTDRADGGVAAHIAAPSQDMGASIVIVLAVNLALGVLVHRSLEQNPTAPLVLLAVAAALAFASCGASAAVARTSAYVRALAWRTATILPWLGLVLTLGALIDVAAQAASPVGLLDSVREAVAWLVWSVLLGPLTLRSLLAAHSAARTGSRHDLAISPAASTEQVSTAHDSH